MTSTGAWQDSADAWRAEWTKTCALASTGWLLTATIALGVALSAAVCAIASHQSSAHQDPVKLALTGIQLAQAVLAVWAVRAVCGEYRTGMIRTTLTAIPQRPRLLAAKTAVIGVLALAAGAVTVTGALLVGRALLDTHRFGAVHHRPFNLGASTTLRAALGSVVYLALISLLGTGVALALRDAAAAAATTLGLLYLFPLAAQVAGNPDWQRLLERVGPTTAGLSIQATADLSTLPVSPWTGLAVLAAWTGLALLVGGIRLQRGRA